MVYLTTSATIKADIDFFQQSSSTYASAYTNLQGSIGYSVGVTGGSGFGVSQTDCIYNLAGYIIPSGETREYDFRSLSQDAFGSPYNLSMTGVKAIMIYNHNTGVQEVLHLKATGLGFSGLFHGESGNLRIEPGSIYTYTNPVFGIEVPENKSRLQITNVGSGGTGEGLTWTGNTGIAISIVSAGTSGTG